MNLFILDDERSARENIKAFLQANNLQVDEIREASSIEQSLEVLSNYKPDLAFLDVNLPDGLSFDLLCRIGLMNIDFKIIFVSAYDDYAIRAFRFNAADYILKPINPVDFKDAINRVLNSDISQQNQSKQLQNLSNDLNHDSKGFEKLVLKDLQGVHIVRIDEIIYCKSESNYTVFFLKDQSKVTISRTLKDYEMILKEKGFFRSHRSHLINLQHIRKYDKREGGFIEMVEGSTVPLSRVKKEVFLKILEKL